MAIPTMTGMGTALGGAGRGNGFGSPIAPKPMNPPALGLPPSGGTNSTGLTQGPPPYPGAGTGLNSTGLTQGPAPSFGGSGLNSTGLTQGPSPYPGAGNVPFTGGITGSGTIQGVGTGGPSFGGGRTGGGDPYMGDPNGFGGPPAGYGNARPMDMGRMPGNPGVAGGPAPFNPPALGLPPSGSQPMPMPGGMSRGPTPISQGPGAMMPGSPGAFGGSTPISPRQRGPISSALMGGGSIPGGPRRGL